MARRSKQPFYSFCITLFMALLMITSNGASAQSQQQSPVFKPEEIEALVAPIALYPDSVLSQILIASTYPLEIVHAARWVKDNPNIKGDAAVKAVQDQPWDVSVKSLVAFPQVLEPMNDKLDWTQKLGDAFLAQEKDVLAAVQRLRARAQQEGNLKSNKQQKVIVEPAPSGGQTTQVIRVEPADPQVIYIPAYNPSVVYGTWSYPPYPPYYWPPYPAYYPGAALASGFAWGIGIAAAAAIFSNADWNHGDVNINVNKAAKIDRNIDRSKFQNGKWQHNPRHRQGVAYRDNVSREKFAKNVPGAKARNDFRGRPSTSDRTALANRGGANNRPSRAPNAGPGSPRAGNAAIPNNRAGISNRPSTKGNLNEGRARNAGPASPRAGNAAIPNNRAGISNRPSAANTYGGRGRDNAFQGVGAGGASQRDFNRGRSSAQSSTFRPPSRPSSGGMRGGGGGRGGRR
ncbi:DUF3300 domain-containing protein [Crenobacter sp. SG2305]|nr:DUF3300 domain-containing protein [Crenobacter sp. SG2305]